MFDFGILPQFSQEIAYSQSVTMIVGAGLGEKTAGTLAFGANTSVGTAAEKVSGGTADIADRTSEAGIAGDRLHFAFNGSCAAAHHTSALMGHKSAESAAAGTAADSLNRGDDRFISGDFPDRKSVV